MATLREKLLGMIDIWCDFERCDFFLFIMSNSNNKNERRKEKRDLKVF